MSFKKRATKSIALALVGITVATPMLNTVSAMEKNSADLQPNIINTNKNLEFINDLEDLITYAKSQGASKQEIKALNELKEMSFDNTLDSGIENGDNERKSAIIKTAIKWMKNNLSKIQKFLKQYFGITISVKWITNALDVVGNISSTLTELTYNFVDLVCDTFSIRCSENNKWIIARALRLLMPI